MISNSEQSAMPVVQTCDYFVSDEGSPTRQFCGRRIETGVYCAFHAEYARCDRIIAKELCASLLAESNEMHRRLVALESDRLRLRLAVPLKLL